MRFSASAAALAMATTVSAHAQVYGLWVNGEDQGDGRNVYIRSPASNSPVKDLTSPDLVCNVNGGKAAPNLNLENDGTGAIWTKIAEDGYDGSEWAVDKLIKAKGKSTFTLPSALKAGKYIVRQEIIAHHESDVAYASNPARGAQFYPSCAQVEVTGSGTAVPDEKFDFNKGYTSTDKGIVFNLYGSYTTYDIPGPAVWKGTSSGSGSDSGSTPETPAATSAAAEAPAATSAAAEAPAATQPAGGNAGSETQAPAPTPTFATVVRPSEGASAPTEAPSAPVTPPKTGCSSKRRRARRAARRSL
ncbi:unnamed protein product [Fusarium fujikuroi]|uniref:lytic cellulose monooxygenase (C4-dehydrogenating) n=1 Tax=Fusarium fujikuroi TaxID=5127 RepID=A0A9Q9U910_FUSFU|nr:unnamed protein product [Fusarium fujikuroi]